MASNLHLLKLMAAVLRYLKKQSLRRQSKKENYPELQEQEVHRRDAQVELLMAYSETQVFDLSSWTYRLDREHHSEIAVSVVLARHPPNHGHS